MHALSAPARNQAPTNRRDKADAVFYRALKRAYRAALKWKQPKDIDWSRAHKKFGAAFRKHHQKKHMNLITATYQDRPILFTEAGWFNATEVAAPYGRRPTDWLSLDSTKEYLSVLSEIIRSEESSLLKVKRGGRGKSDATWFCPDLAVPFARWLDVRFGVWCDQQIKQLLTSQHPAFDWKRSRHAAASTNKVMAAVLQQIRERQGKDTAAHHYSNEARLVNFALTGVFCGLDRNSLTQSDLDLLAALEERNAVLIGCGLLYAERKTDLLHFAAERRPALAIH
jgi:hypothetical protein